MFWVTGLMGVASMLAPFILDYGTDTTAMWVSLMIGLILITVSVLEWAADDKQNWEYWIAGGAGLMAIIMPFVLGAGNITGMEWTLVVIGFITMGAVSLKLYSGKSQY